MTSRPIPHDSLQRICVRAPNWVGDAVMATPTLRALRAHFPSARITLIAPRGVALVLQGAPWFDDLLRCRAGELGPARDFLRCARELRGRGCELGFALPSSFSSALMLWMARVPRRVGYARDLRSALLTDAVPRPSDGGRFVPTYMVDFYLRLCQEVGIVAQDRRTELFFSPEDAAQADRILQARGIQPGEPLVLLHPGASFGPSKRWPAGSFGALADLLARDRQARIAIIGSPAERGASAEIVAGAGALVTDLTDCGIDLHLLKCVVARTSLLVTTDSGPRHYGVALGIPTVCIMGPTHPGYSTSAKPNDHVLRVEVPCGPCQRKACRRDHRCMEAITPAMAYEACVQAMAGTAAGAVND